ncbi:MAG: four helix bundle protein [Thermoplasmata archaeon]|nr:four helix bundle protein [Thermoplasmata archaeon]
MDENKGHEKLKVYQKAHKLAVKIHKMTFSLPKFEIFEEGSQIRRSSKSVSSNIVEGYALRKYKKEYLHHLYRAYASCEETTEHLLYVNETESLKDEDIYNDLDEGYNILNRMLFNFIASVEKHHGTPYFITNIKND